MLSIKQKAYKFWTYIILTLPLSIWGQNMVSIGYGTTLYKGDLSLPGFFEDFKNAGQAFQIQYKAPLNKQMKLRLGFMAGQIKGDDAGASTLAQRQRNLKFFSSIKEGQLALEYTFSDRFMRNSPLSLYAVGGLVYFSFDPQTNYNGIERKLAPLKTENQTVAYKTKDFALQMGGGIQLELNEAIALNFELVGRLTNTDYLDDVSGGYPDYNLVLDSQGPITAALSDRRDEFFNLPEGTTDAPGIGTNGTRGNPNSKDYYITGILSIIIHLNPDFNSGTKGILCPKL